jgi:hypothetical protein
MMYGGLVRIVYEAEDWLDAPRAIPAIREPRSQRHQTSSFEESHSSRENPALISIGRQGEGAKTLKERGRCGITEFPNLLLLSHWTLPTLKAFNPLKIMILHVTSGAKDLGSVRNHI